MKKVKLILFLFLMVLPCLSHATTLGEPEIPKNILTKLDSLYPKATQVDWVKDGMHYQADFVYNNKCISIVFKKNGSEVYFREEIEASALPAAVTESVKKAYLDKGYKTAYIMSRWTKSDYGNQKIYEIEVIKGRRLYFARYDATGKLVTVYEMGKMDVSKDPFITP